MNATMIEGPRLAGRIAVVTGTGGLGLEAATALALEGAEVILAGRNPEKGADAVRRIKDAWFGANATFRPLDLASLRSVAEFAERLQADVGRVDLLVNNAGIMSPPRRQTTADGFELQFGVNYLGHFALTARLLPLLRRSAAPRVVSVTSLAHRYAAIEFDDLQSQRRYQAGRAYCQSKLAQALFAVELQRRSEQAGWGLASLAAHPGYAGTDLFQNGAGARSLSNLLSRYVVIPLIGQSAQAGALPILFAATSEGAAGGGLYGPTGFMTMKGPPGRNEFAAAAKDPDAAARLRTLSEDLAQVRL
jgi:NAD(P)-dependent dehydrogenase (short-subunit alcohol dehydrogenase family)